MANILYGSGLRILQNKDYESDLNKPYKINRFIKKFIWILVIEKNGLTDKRNEFESGTLYRTGI